MGIQLYLANHLVHSLPPTRLYRLKALLYRWAGLKVDPSARLLSSVSIWGQMPLVIGRDTFVGHEVLIVGATEKIAIGNGVDIAPRVCIVSGSHEIDMVGLHSAGKGKCAPIVIEDGVWIGVGALVLGGVTIGRKSVIGAGSIVVSDIPPETIAVGNPCRPIKIWEPTSAKWIRI
jgi:maltose O-acetyltransferase